MSETIDSAIEAILRGELPPAKSSRREFPRYSVSYPILIEVRGRESSVSGVTINLARNGMLANVAEPIPLGATCTIGFIPGDRFRPELVECPHCGSEFPMLSLPEEPIRGKVVRMEAAPVGFAAAVLFDQPLQVLGGAPRNGGHRS